MRPVLFNLSQDIGEEHNILSSNPDIARELEKLRQQWDAKLMEPRFLGLIHTNSWKKRKKN